MTHIKEPKGVDFIIQSDELTDAARQEISEFIRAYKAQATRPPVRPKVTRSTRKPAARR